MAKKSELETMEKLKKLSSVINPKEAKKVKPPKPEIEKKKPKKETKKTDKNKQSTFKTSEVIVIMIITMFISLTLGGVFSLKLFKGTGEKVETELQNFINDYEYIKDNYNGKIDKEELFKAALNGMLGELDENSMVLDGTSGNNFSIRLDGSYVGLGATVFVNENDQIEIADIVKDSPASKAGLKTGDIITKFNNETIKKLSTEKFSKKVKSNKKFELTYLRDKKETKVKINTSKITLTSVATKTFKNNDKKIGYIYISIFAQNTYEQFKEKLNELKKENIDSLIIDVRTNSGGHLSTADKIISLFLDSSHPIYQIKKDDKVTKYYSKGNKDETLKIAILVNGSSASASELLTSALSEQLDAKVIGKKTYGKGSVQEMQDLSNGAKFKITTKNWLTSKGVWIDGKGIKPDIEVDLNKEYLDDPIDKNDNQLQRAISELSK